MNNGRGVLIGILQLLESSKSTERKRGIKQLEEWLQGLDDETENSLWDDAVLVGWEEVVDKCVVCMEAELQGKRSASILTNLTRSFRRVIEQIMNISSLSVGIQGFNLFHHVGKNLYREGVTEEYSSLLSSAMRYSRVANQIKASFSPIVRFVASLLGKENLPRYQQLLEDLLRYYRGDLSSKSREDLFNFFLNVVGAEEDISKRLLNSLELFSRRVAMDDTARLASLLDKILSPLMKVMTHSSSPESKLSVVNILRLFVATHTHLGQPRSLRPLYDFVIRCADSLEFLDEYRASFKQKLSDEFYAMCGELLIVYDKVLEDSSASGVDEQVTQSCEAGDEKVGMKRKNVASSGELPRKRGRTDARIWRTLIEKIISSNSIPFAWLRIMISFLNGESGREHEMKEDAASTLEILKVVQEKFGLSSCMLDAMQCTLQYLDYDEQETISDIRAFWKNAQHLVHDGMMTVPRSRAVQTRDSFYSFARTLMRRTDTKVAFNHNSDFEILCSSHFGDGAYLTRDMWRFILEVVKKNCLPLSLVSIDGRPIRMALLDVVLGKVMSGVHTQHSSGCSTILANTAELAAVVLALCGFQTEGDSCPSFHSLNHSEVGRELISAFQAVSSLAFEVSSNIGHNGDNECPAVGLVSFAQRSEDRKRMIDLLSESLEYCIVSAENGTTKEEADSFDRVEVSAQLSVFLIHVAHLFPKDSCGQLEDELLHKVLEGVRKLTCSIIDKLHDILRMEEWNFDATLVSRMDLVSLFIKCVAFLVNEVTNDREACDLNMLLQLFDDMTVKFCSFQKRAVPGDWIEQRQSAESFEPLYWIILDLLSSLAEYPRDAQCVSNTAVHLLKEPSVCGNSELYISFNALLAKVTPTERRPGVLNEVLDGLDEIQCWKTDEGLVALVLELFRNSVIRMDSKMSWHNEVPRIRTIFEATRTMSSSIRSVATEVASELANVSSENSKGYFVDFTIASLAQDSCLGTQLIAMKVLPSICQCTEVFVEKQRLLLALEKSMFTATRDISNTALRVCALMLREILKVTDFLDGEIAYFLARLLSVPETFRKLMMEALSGTFSGYQTLYKFMWSNLRHVISRWISEEISVDFPLELLPVDTDKMECVRVVIPSSLVAFFRLGSHVDVDAQLCAVAKRIIPNADSSALFREFIGEIVGTVLPFPDPMQYVINRVKESSDLERLVSKNLRAVFTHLMDGLYPKDYQQEFTFSIQEVESSMHLLFADRRKLIISIWKNKENAFWLLHHIHSKVFEADRVCCRVSAVTMMSFLSSYLLEFKLHGKPWFLETGCTKYMFVLLSIFVDYDETRDESLRIAHSCLDSIEKYYSSSQEDVPKGIATAVSNFCLKLERFCSSDGDSLKFLKSVISCRKNFNKPNIVAFKSRLGLDLEFLGNEYPNGSERTSNSDRLSRYINRLLTGHGSVEESVTMKVLLKRVLALLQESSRNFELLSEVDDSKLYSFKSLLLDCLRSGEEEYNVLAVECLLRLTAASSSTFGTIQGKGEYIGSEPEFWRFYNLFLLRGVETVKTSQRSSCIQDKEVELEEVVLGVLDCLLTDTDSVVVGETAKVCPRVRKQLNHVTRSTLSTMYEHSCSCMMHVSEAENVDVTAPPVLTQSCFVSFCISNFAQESGSFSDFYVWSLPGRTYEEWISGLCAALLNDDRTGIESRALRACAPLCRLRSDVAEILFPYALYEISVSSRAHDSLVKTISRCILDHIFISMVQNPSKAGQHYISATRLLLFAINTLRSERLKVFASYSQYNKDTRYTPRQSRMLKWTSPCWLEIEADMLSKVAALAKLPYTCFLYSEYLLEEECCLKCLPRDLFPTEDIPEYMQILYGVIKDQIRDVDVLEGAMLPSAIADVHQSEGKYEGALARRVYEMDVDKPNEGALRNIACSLRSLGFYQMYSYSSGNPFIQEECAPLSRELTYEAAWRLGRWDLEGFKFQDDGVNYTFCFDELIFKVMRSLVRREEQSFRSNLNLAFRNVTSLSEFYGNESRAFVKYVMLTDMKDAWECFQECNDDFASQVNKVFNRWNPQQERITAFNYGFEVLEPIYDARRVILEGLLDMNDKGCQSTVGNYLVKVASLARASGVLGHSLKTVLYARRRTNLEAVVATTVLEEAKVVAEQKDIQTSIRLLKSLVQHMELSSSTFDNALRAESYITLGEYSGIAHSESSRVVEELLEKGVSLGCDTPSIKGRAHMSLAKFLDNLSSALKEKISSPELRENLISARSNTREMKKFMNSKVGSSVKRAVECMDKEASAQKLERRREWRRLVELLRKASLNYRLAVESHGVDDYLAVFRIITLWFAHTATATLKLCDNTDPGVEDDARLLADALFGEVCKVDTCKLLPLSYQIAARMGYPPAEGDAFSEQVQSLVSNIAQHHPHHMVFILMAMINSSGDSHAQVDEVASARRSGATESLNHLQRTKHSFVEKSKELSDAYAELALAEVKKEYRKTNSLEISGKTLSQKKKYAICQLRNITEIPVLTREQPVREDGRYENSFTYIVGFGKHYSLFGGLTLPKAIVCKCSDGTTHREIVKGNDDLRQDAVILSYMGFVDKLLTKNKRTRSRHLRIRTFNVVPLSSNVGVMEFVENSEPLGHYLLGKKGAHERYRGNKDYSDKRCSQAMETIPFDDVERRKQVFANICDNFNPVFHHFFLEKFPDPALWFQKRLSYTRSVATSSIVGYIVGLGDRHCSNILVDENTAEVVHIDLGIAFDQGKQLRFPELVPFRLTRDVVDGFGVCGVEGVFRRSCEEVLRVLRENERLVTSLLEVFLFDPLYSWTLTPEKVERILKERKKNLAPAPTSIDAEHGNRYARKKLHEVREKTMGYENGERLSVEGQVDMLITQARDMDNLSRLFHGWRPWV